MKIKEGDFVVIGAAEHSIKAKVNAVYSPNERNTEYFVVGYDLIPFHGWIAQDQILSVEKV